LRRIGNNQIQKKEIFLKKNLPTNFLKNSRQTLEKF